MARHSVRGGKMTVRASIGILGGTFNPIHAGHLILAQTAFETLALDRILFIPCAQPPHKSDTGLLSAAHRLAMVQLAVQEDDRFAIDDQEIRRGGISYAIDTVQALRQLHPGAPLTFIIGADTLLELHLWHRIHKLLDLCRFVAFTREAVEADRIQPQDLKLDPPWPERLLADTHAGRRIDISATDIRRRVAEGRSIRYLVPDLIERYVTENRLYDRTDEEKEDAHRRAHAGQKSCPGP